MKNITPEIIEKAKVAKSADELLEIAKENEIEMTEEEAAAYYAQLNPKSGELDDDELDNVAGGGCGDTYEKFPPAGTIVTAKTKTCPICGGNRGVLNFSMIYWRVNCINNCKPTSSSPSGGLLACDNDTTRLDFKQFAAEFDY